jgi:2-oxoglutarate dehydrogenase complex dehydrogenase (E1) component-like enzyme
MPAEDIDFGPNVGLVEEIYRQWQEDPSSVAESWQDFFADYKPRLPGQKHRRPKHRRPKRRRPKHRRPKRRRRNRLLLRHPLPMEQLRSRVRRRSS